MDAYRVVLDDGTEFKDIEAYDISLCDEGHGDAYYRFIDGSESVVMIVPAGWVKYILRTKIGQVTGG